MLLTLVALLSYLGTLTLGTLSLRGRRVKRVWHKRLFMLTVVWTVVAAVCSFPAQWLRGLMLTLALIPLGLLPFLTVPVSAHSRRHALIGLSAAPCYLGATVLSAVPPR